ncbi:hypothetical protein TSO221_32680 [Azospirillum sp. TSO22-1]|nr:hypothetical protein TSO221_32680 [Azospirillum sp. TSO22-1]
MGVRLIKQEKAFVLASEPHQPQYAEELLFAITDLMKGYFAIDVFFLNPDSYFTNKIRDIEGFQKRKKGSLVIEGSRYLVENIHVFDKNIDLLLIRRLGPVVVLFASVIRDRRKCVRPEFFQKPAYKSGRVPEILRIH